MQQIHEATHYIRRAEELGHPHLWSSYTAFLEFLAHYKSALNSYAKCFISAGPGQIRLDPMPVFQSDPTYLEKHNRLINLRHKYIAHNDENEIESVIVVEEDAPNELLLRLQYVVSFPFDRLYELLELIRLVEVYVVDRQNAHLSAVKREIGKPVRIAEGLDEETELHH